MASVGLVHLYATIAFAAVIGIMLCMLKILAVVAHSQMAPRPMYLKPDKFRDYEGNQNWNWDFVLVFDIRPTDWKGTAFQRAHTLRKVIEKLKNGKLETFIFKSQHHDKMFVKVRVSALRLREHADKINYPLRIDEDMVKKTIMEGKKDPITDGWVWWPRKNGWKEQGKDINTAIQDEKGQSDIPYYQYIYGDFQPEKDEIYQQYQPSNSLFRGVDRVKIIISILESAVHNDGCGLNLNRLCVEKAVLAVYPLHDDDELLMLQSKWITAFAWPWNQPIERVKDYFGEKIALYFCWLGHYTTWLIGAAVLGGITYAIVVFASMAHDADDVPYEASPTNPVPLFAFLMALWATFFLEYWKREEKRRAMMWGMVGFEDTEEDRPEYEGLDIRSPINGGPDTYFPAAEKNKRVLASQTIIVLCAVCVLGAVLGIFLFKAVIEAPPVDMMFAIPGVIMGGDPYPIGGIFASVVNAAQIQIMNNVYSRVAHFLNALENHRTETLYEDNLIAKTFVFQFVNSYTSLFYIAFVKDLTAPKYEAIFDKTGVSARSFMCKKSCMTELSGQLGTIFITRLLVGNITEVVLPAVRIKQAQAAARKVEHDDSEYDDPHLIATMRKRQRSPAEEQFELDYYDQLLGTFSDYAELVMQFGYATLFVSAFPLAPLMAFVNNYVEIRVDGWKLCQNCRRPLPSGAEDIGTWQSILEIMSVCAVVCNCALITYTGEFLSSGYTSTYRVFIFIALEHVLFFAKALFAAIVDDIPAEVELQIERQEFLRSKIINNAKDEDLELDEDEDADLDEPPEIYEEDKDL